MEIIASPSIKPVVWIGSTRADLASFPEDAMGYALYIAQRGGKHADAKPLRGFGGAGILEIVEDHTGDTYPALYRSAWRVWRVAICLTCVSEEIKERDPDAERRDRANQIASQASRRRTHSRAATHPNSRRAHPKD